MIGVRRARAGRGLLGLLLIVSTAAAGAPAGATGGAAAGATGAGWASSLALGPTDASSLAARPGLLLAGGRPHLKDGTTSPLPGPRVPGLFRSTDAGRTWTLAERVGANGLEPVSSTPDLLAVATGSPAAYAAFGLAVWRSDDEGRTWAPVGTTAGQATTLDVLPTGRVLAGLSSGGLLASDDLGKTWSALGSGLPASRVNEVLLTSAGHLLVATSTGLFRSTDAGATFARVTTGLLDPSANAFGVAGDGGSLLYLAMPGPTTLSTSVYASTDGSSWQPRVAPIGQNLLPRVSPGAFDVVVQGSLYLLYAGTQGGLFRSGTLTQAGLEWERLDPEPGGLAVTDLAVADADPGPLRDDTVFATVKRSSPAAVTRSAVRLTAPGWIDELDGGRICGGLVAREDGALFAACGRHVLRSDDGGSTWAAAGRGLPYITVGVADTPYNPLAGSADGSLWTSGFDYGLYRSDAAVSQWRKLPFPGASVSAIGTHPTDAGTVYAAGLLTNGSTGPLYKTTDGGTTWGRPLLDLGTSIYNISVSPAAPQQVIVAAYNRGLWRSTDGGATWAAAQGISGDVYRALHSPASPARAWALTSDGVFRSDDGGGSWTGLGPVTVGGDLKSTYEIAVSPWQADTLYSLSIDGDLVVSTDGAQTWSRFDDGLPKHPTCGICEEIQHLEFSRTQPGQLYIAAGVLGSGVAPQSMWIYRRSVPVGAGS